MPLRGSCASSRRAGELCRLDRVVGLDQEQFALAEPQERFATLRIGASTQHFEWPPAPANISATTIGESQGPAFIARLVPRMSLVQEACVHAKGRLFRSPCRLIGNGCRPLVAGSLPALRSGSYHSWYAQGSGLSAELF